MWKQNFLKISLVLLVGQYLCQTTPNAVDVQDAINDIFKTPHNRLSKPAIQPRPTNTTVLNPTPRTNPNPLPETKSKSCGFEKECVPRFQCINGTANIFGENVIKIRTNVEDCNFLQVCCDMNNKIEKPITPIDVPEGCGYRNPNGVGFRITGANDNEAEFGEFPWMVAILRQEDAGDQILNLNECGGSLIAPNVVVTAAHCVNNRSPEELSVRAGEWDTQSTSEVLPYQDLNVKEIIAHEHYNKGALFNDIAVLLLDGDFRWDANVLPVCLPPINQNFDHARCFATGWGKDQFGKEGKYQVILKKIDMPVVPRNKCQANLRTTRLGYYFQLHESFICAGGEKGKDTCKGDGGSPLVCPIPGQNGRYYQAGIVAWGIGCADENIPGVYASVAHLRQWLDEKLSLWGIDSKYFTP